MCGLAPSRALSKDDSVMHSWGKVALRTILPSNSDSPSPGLSTTPAIDGEYAGRAPAGAPTSDAPEGAARAGRRVEAEARPVRRAPCALVVLVPRRRLAPGGA